MPSNISLELFFLHYLWSGFTLDITVIYTATKINFKQIFFVALMAGFYIWPPSYLYFWFSMETGHSVKGVISLQQKYCNHEIIWSQYNMMCFNFMDQNGEVTIYYGSSTYTPTNHKFPHMKVQQVLNVIVESLSSSPLNWCLALTGTSFLTFSGLTFQLYDLPLTFLESGSDW